MQNSVKRTRDSEGWRRCSEGFTDFLTKEVEKNKLDRTRRPSTDSTASKQKDTFTPGNIFEKLAFPSEDTSQSIAWSSSENEEEKPLVEPVKKRKKLSPRVVTKKTRRSLGQTNSQEEKEVVILSSSDTEKDEKAKASKDGTAKGQTNSRKEKEVVILSSSDTEKEEKTKATRDGTVKKDRNLWERKEVVILSSSDTEKDEKKDTQDTVPSEKSEVVSIRGYESDQEGRELSREKTPPPSQESNSQSSVTISTQSSTGTQAVFGVKASDWVKSLQLKTPSKSEQASVSCDVEDSARKKKKHSRGGFAEQLNRLQNRDKSSVRVWKHQHTTVSSSQDARSVSLRVLGFEYLYSLQLIRCKVVNQPADQGTQDVAANEGVRLVMLPVSQAEQLKLQPGAIFKICPPWQQLELSTGQQIMLCAKYCHVLEQSDSQLDLIVEDNQGKQQDLTAVWNCPCVQGLCTSQTLCPAYQFPCVPGYIQEIDDSGDSKAQTIDNNSNTLKAAENLHPNSKMAAQSSSSSNPSNTAQVKSHLHTVGLQSKGSKSKSESSDSSGSRVWDSILESIEFVRSMGDNSCLCFKGHVHKTAQISDGEKSKSYHLFVEDVVGTVCVIKLTSNSLQGLEVEEQCMEGKTFQFSGLKVQDRVTRDRDPHLLSMIDRVWSGTAVSKVTSQDTQEEIIGNKKTDKPAGFCYILEEVPGITIEMLPCLVDLHVEREITLQSLVDISKPCDICNRCDLIVKIVYLNFDDKKKQQLNSAFVVDHLKTNPVCVKYNCTTAESSLELNHSGQRCKLIRDLCIYDGDFIIDDYTTIVNDTNLIKSLQTSENHNSLSNTQPTPNIITKQCNIDDIVCVTGVICEIDEESAYSWEVCKNCGSDQIQVDDKTGSSKCNDCKHTMDEADVKMKMEVIVNVSSSNMKVKVDLLQSTIESLLPKDEEDEDGYELSSVLNKQLGPLNGLILNRTGQNWAFFLKEIKLLS